VASPSSKLTYESTLRELLHHSDATVRLTNCIVSDPQLGAMTIGEYLENTDISYAKSLKTRNMGAKSAQELKEIVLACAPLLAQDSEPANSGASEAPAENPAVNPRDLIISDLCQVKFPEALFDFDLSVRLRGILEKFAADQEKGRQPAMLLSTLGQVVNKWDSTTAAIKSFGNFGSKSLYELKCFTEELVNRRFQELFPQIKLREPLHIEDLSPDLSPNIARELNGIGNSTGTAECRNETVEHSETAGADVRQRVLSILKGLPAKENAVLLRRYGLGGFPPKTLEEIGKEFYVTRERVRQIEKKAINRLRGAPSKLAAFKTLLSHEQASIWNLLSQNSELLLPEDIENRQREIEPLKQLALDIVFDGVRKWVAAEGRFFHGGWLRSDKRLEDVRSAIAEVRSFLRSRPLPRSVIGIVEALQSDRQEVITAIRITENLRVFEDYVLEGIVGTQARRTIRLHKRFLELQGDDLIDFTIVLDDYRLRYPDDDAVSRVFDLHMNRAPHLFAHMFGSVWLALPDHGLAIRRGGKITFNQSHVTFDTFDRMPEDDTISRWLLAELRRRGPSRHVDLRDRAMRKFRGEIESTSIGAVLLMNPTFIRLAPGVFGLQEHLPALLEGGASFPDSFFGNPHCRYFALARKAGEPMSLYPAWSYGFEAQLCKWAKRHSPGDLFRSLLDVAEPDKWPSTSDEKKRWTVEKATYGSYKLARPAPSIEEAKPLQEIELLSALAFLGTLGGISWVSVNRIAHRRTDDTDAVADLALLIALNAIQPAGNWQDRHMPSANYSALYARIAAELAQVGRLNWHEGQLRAILVEAAEKVPKRNLGWVSKKDATALLERLLMMTHSTTTFSEPDDILGSNWAAHFNE
jgi:RNA polymerase sigma factor (sigma-70 family)